MSKYGQYCPLSLAAEILCERWNILIIRKMIEGYSRFNDIHKGMPKITAGLLSSRLRDLEHANLITRTPLERGRGYDYQLAPAGQALQPIVKSLAVWGQEWARDMVHEDLDPTFLLWQMHSRLNTDVMPAGRTVIELEFTGAPRGCKRFWLISTDGVVDMCLKNPGYDPHLVIMSDLRLFVETWRGIRDLRGELAKGAIRVEGSSSLVRKLPDILLLSEIADTRRKRPGPEKSLAPALPAK